MINAKLAGQSDSNHQTIVKLSPPRTPPNALNSPCLPPIPGTSQLMSNFAATTRTQVHPGGPPLGHSSSALSLRVQTQSAYV